MTIALRDLEQKGRASRLELTASTVECIQKLITII